MTPIAAACGEIATRVSLAGGSPRDKPRARSPLSLDRARALLTRPKILILDEATSALDPESEAIIRGNFAQIAAGRTVINVSHRLTNLVDMDRIVVIDAGRIVDVGPHAELLVRCELYQSLWYTQNPHQRA